MDISDWAKSTLIGIICLSILCNITSHVLIKGAPIARNGVKKYSIALISYVYVRFWGDRDRRIATTVLASPFIIFGILGLLNSGFWVLATILLAFNLVVTLRKDGNAWLARRRVGKYNNQH